MRLLIIAGQFSFKRNYAEAYNNRGIAYQKKCEIIYAVQDYSTAIGLKPELGRAVRQSRQFSISADKIFTGLSMTAPRHSGWIRTRVVAYATCGVAWLHYGHWKKAKADFTVATILRVDISAVFRHFYENTEETLSRKQKFRYQRISRRCWCPKRSYLNLRRAHDLSLL